jgi:hypothetical protein
MVAAVGARLRTLAGVGKGSFPKMLLRALASDPEVVAVVFLWGAF